jgi:hypothetical protein
MSEIKNLRVRLGHQTLSGMLTGQGYITLVNSSGELPSLLITTHPVDQEFIGKAVAYLASAPEANPSEPATAVPALPPASELETQMLEAEFDPTHFDLLEKVEGETLRDSVIRQMRYIKKRVEFSRVSKIPVERGVAAMIARWTQDELWLAHELSTNNEFMSVEMAELGEVAIGLYFSRLAEQKKTEKEVDEAE